MIQPMSYQGYMQPGMYNQYFNYGAYPNGYVPPNYAQMPMQQMQMYPQQSYMQSQIYQPPVQEVPNVYDSKYSVFTPQPYRPGAVHPIQVESSDGTVREITVNYGDNNTNTTPYVQGGTLVNQGGYNPISRTTIPGSASAPYMNIDESKLPKEMLDNGYNRMRTDPGENPYGGPNRIPLPPNAYTNRPFNYNSNPWMSPSYGYVQGYSYNQFDLPMQEFLYNEDPSATYFDVEGMLSEIILSDQERERIGKNRQTQSLIVGRDYYGRPIYSQPMSYQTNQSMQEQIQFIRENHQNLFVKLAKVAAAYTGDETPINEDRVKEIFDPFPQPKQPIMQQPKFFNYYSASEEEKKEYNREVQLQRTFAIADKFNQLDMAQNQIQATKQMCFAQIKASHDKLLGVEPGESYDLSKFMTNGYMLGIANQNQELKKQNRNGLNKYQRSEYRTGLAQSTNTSIPLDSKDDGYVSVEELIKAMYDKNRNAANEITSVVISGDGKTEFYRAPQTTDEEDRAHRLRYFESVQEKKVIDDARRGV